MYGFRFAPASEARRAKIAACHVPATRRDRCRRGWSLGVTGEKGSDVILEALYERGSIEKEDWKRILNVNDSGSMGLG